MSLLICQDVKKHYGAQDVLRGVTFQIDPGEKLGLIGKNGGGKSTILRLVEGVEVADHGRVSLRKGASLGHVPQIPEFEAGITVLQYVELGLAEVRALQRELDTIGERMSHAEGDELEKLVHEHEAKSQRIGDLGGWEIARRIEVVLSGIGLAKELWSREARTLSGGERSRVALARELVAGHDLLLLDEPTNHLDLVGIEWLESWLHEQKGAVLIVSHDRRLLNRAVDGILELERGEIRRYPGNYDKYVVLREERYKTELREWESQQDFLRKEEDFIRKHIGSQRTAEAKGRQKRLENLVRVDRPFNDVRRPAIRAPKVERGGELVFETRDLAGGYGEKKLFQHVDLRVGRSDRIGVVGKNGAGKSTLLRILAGLQPPLGGELEPGHKSVCGYYDQDTSQLDETRTPYEEIRRTHRDMTDLEIRSHLARFLFRGNEVDKSIAALSGGERARVALAKLVLEKPTWLALDEPTNHLDLAARAALEEMLSEFDGTLVCVSHDRAFLDALCTKIVCVDPDAVTVFDGNYTAWRDAVLAASDQRRALAAEKPKRDEKRVEPPKAAKPAKAASPGKVRNRYLFDKLEARIMELEAEQKKLNDELVREDVYRNAARMKETQIRIAEVEHELAERYAEWENWR
ncbi:MAG: ABC-F family ATP-binding cassette domain-containing protein [Planctomycetes bacterium]|nr:ABC-F family ATP-binding cassette domain-containing protein [Planctomycetota bacterium]